VKDDLYQVAARTNRGQLATETEKTTVLNYVAQLERIGSDTILSAVVDPSLGKWELIYRWIVVVVVVMMMMMMTMMMTDHQDESDNPSFLPPPSSLHSSLHQ